MSRKLTEQKEFSFLHESAAFDLVKKNLLESNCSKVLILDLDETVTNTVLLWVKLLNRLLKKRGNSLELPTLTQVQIVGGTDFIYNSENYFGEQDYSLLMALLRGLIVPNLYAPPTEDNIEQILEKLKASDIEPIGAITARPNTTRVLTATNLYFAKNNFPNIPVVARPEDTVPLSQTTPWKLEQLMVLNSLDESKRVIIIDDSISLARKIAEYNSHNGMSKHIIQVLYPGPLTIGKIVSGEIKENKDEGIFISNWQNLLATVERIQAVYG